MELIKNLNDLKALISQKEPDGLECFIALRGGARSSKRIRYSSALKLFEVYNEIDDSFQELKAEELFTQSNVGLALEGDALYSY